VKNQYVMILFIGAKLADDEALVATNEAVNMQVYPQLPPGVNTASITLKQLF
jgi:hypothetical protein